VALARHRAAAQHAGQPAVDKPVDEAGGERRLEHQRRDHRDGQEQLQRLGAVRTPSAGSTVTSVLALP
jgi:hypothetical protein